MRALARIATLTSIFEADVAGAVVDRDAEDVGAHVRHADAGGQVEPDLVSALRVEEGDEAGASCRRHLKHSGVTPPRKLKPGEKGEEAKSGICSKVARFRGKRAPSKVGSAARVMGQAG